MIITLIFFLLFTIFLIFSISENSVQGFVVGVVYIIMISIILIAVYYEGRDVGYKMGQVDYYNGIMRYELKIKQPDSLNIDNWNEIK